MLQLKFLLRVLVALLVLQTLSGCADPRSRGDEIDIQERLSAVISRNGFSHGLRSQRDGDRHVDSIYIRVPLDSLKRRHYSLERLMKDVGRICTLPEYSGYPIRIEFGAGDETDRLYLKEALLKEIGQKINIRVFVESEDYNDILITFEHPSQSHR